MSSISVIVPIFNVEKYIKECVISLLNQSFKDFEILFIDDKCDDKTVEIIETFKDDKIKIFKNDKKGAGAARNFGLSLAKSEWIVFFDGDDFCNENYLKKLYERAKEQDADVVICGSLDYSERKKRFSKPRKSHTLECVDVALEHCAKSLDEMDDFVADSLLDLAEPWNKIYRRNFLIQNNIKFSEIMCSEDLPFSYEVLFKAKKISFVKENLVFARRRASSLSYSVNKNWINYFTAYKITDEIAFNYAYFEKIKAAYFNRKFRTYKYFYKKAGVLCKIPYLFKFLKEMKRVNEILKERKYGLLKILLP